MSAARDRILARVREAVRVPAARPPLASDGPLFAAVTDAQAEFREAFLALKGEIIDSEPALRGFLAGFARIATDGSALVREAVGAARADVHADVREADLGVTSCDCLIAQLGTILVTARSAGGRALSVLPPAHLVIARRDQLLPDLGAALALVRRRYQESWPSALSVLGGPSRTGDIEKIIVMGAHGPKRLALYWSD